MKNDNNMVGIIAVTKATGMSKKNIMVECEKGRIEATMQEGHLKFTKSELMRLKDLNEEYISSRKFISELALHSKKFNFNHKKCMEDFYEYIEINNFFGCTIMKSDDVFFSITKNERYFLNVSCIAKFKNNILLWLSSYGADDKEKVNLLLKKLKETLPVTAKYLQNFCESNAEINASAMCNLIDFLCYAMNSEIKYMTSDAIDVLVDNLVENLPRNSVALFNEFRDFARKKHSLHNGWGYKLLQKNIKENNTAYPAGDFVTMAYTVFNPEAWEREKLIQKARSSKIYADLWLFTAMHFVCGWRGTDILKLPKPYLPKDIYAGNDLSINMDFRSIATELEYRLSYSSLTPNKMKRFQNIPTLKLFIPTSIKREFGIIMAISALHHFEVEEGMPFLVNSWRYGEFKCFFGEEFAKACGYKQFSTRCANKSYLQGIEVFADNSEYQPRGYILASIARSHKGGYGALPNTTDVYLHDAVFSGQNPEYISKEVFERGVFSFIPAVLLKLYEDKVYDSLTVSAQTKALQAVNISPQQLESITGMIIKSFEKSRMAVCEVIKNSKNIVETVYDILKNIAKDNAPARQDNLMCLMTAAEQKCPYSRRNSCIGCGYEIYTSGILRMLTKEYKRLLYKKHNSTKESEKYNSILKQAVIPAISEILSAAAEMYPDEDISFLVNIVESGVEND